MRWGSSVSAWELFQVREVTWVPAIRGVNLGSWLVLEQWMLPTTFDWSKTWKDGSVVSHGRGKGGAGVHLLTAGVPLCCTDNLCPHTPPCTRSPPLCCRPSLSFSLAVQAERRELRQVGGGSSSNRKGE